MSRLYTGGTFDLFHFGHMNFLSQCNVLADEIIVGLNTDDFVLEYKGESPALSFEERKRALLSCGLVDDVIKNIGGKDSKPTILEVDPDIICIGDDWAKRDYYSQMGFTQEWLDKNRIVLCYVPYCKSISSTEIKRRIKNS
ncbi:MAG: adenylyltransferase/cytidyltransferase family protein [Candidatus Bathyarchaeota archaeon]|nr:adenylyltransferase/cytidyltransferase family protein [Candidatus Bathyarchaeota archaeon]